MTRALGQFVLDAQFSDPNLSEPAEWLADGSATPSGVANCRVMVRAEDAGFDLDGLTTKLVTKYSWLSVRVSEVPDLKTGHVFHLGGEVWRVAEAPEKADAARLKWQARVQVVGQLGG